MSSIPDTPSARLLAAVRESLAASSRRPRDPDEPEGRRDWLRMLRYYLEVRLRRAGGPIR